jgi:hypothetical protein
MNRKQPACAALKIATAAVAVTMLAACGATTLDRLQGEYRAAYTGLAATEARARTGQADPEGKLTLADTTRSFQIALADVAREAVREGAAESDPRTAIGFYLVAALSAWQAGPEGWEVLPDIVDEGARKCAQLAGSPTRPPRDCAQIVVVPALAVNDQLVAAILELRGRIGTAAASGAALEALKADARQLYSDTRDNVLRLQRHGRTVSESAGISQSYVRYYEQQQMVLYCNHYEVASLLWDPPFNDRSAREAAQEIGKQLPESVRQEGCPPRWGRP